MADNSTKIVITAETSQAEANLKRLGGSASSLGNSLKDLPAALGAFAGALSVGTVAAFAKSTIDAADAMNDLAQRTQIPIAELAKYKLAADQSGTSIEAIGKGVKALSGFMVENGEALRAAGINATDADGALRQLADMFAAMPDGVEKLTLATKIFGKAGQELIPILNAGSKGLDDSAEKSAKYAKALEQLAPKADEFNDNLAELQLNLTALSINALQPMMDGLIGLAKLLNDAAAGGERLGSAVSFLAQQSKTPAAVQGALPGPFQLLSRLKDQGLDLISQGADNITPGGSRTSSGKIGGIPAGIGVDTADSILARLRTNALINGTPTGPGGGRARAGSAASPRSPFANIGSALSNDAGDIVEVLNRNAKIEEDRAREIAAIVAETESGKLEARRAAMQSAVRLFEEGALTEAQWLEYATAQNEKFTDQAKDSFGELEQAINGWARSSADAIVDFVSGTETSFSGMVDSILKDIARLTVNEYLTKPLFSGLTSSMQGGGAGFDGLLKLLGLGGGGYGDVAGVAAGVPQFASGIDYVPRDMLAMIHKGERVVPAAQNGSGGGPVSIVVNVPPGSPAETRRAAGQGAREAMAALSGARRYA